MSKYMPLALLGVSVAALYFWNKSNTAGSTNAITQLGQINQATLNFLKSAG
jgi:hypothetical protein